MAKASERPQAASLRDALTLSPGVGARPALIPPDGRIDYYRQRIADYQQRHPGKPVPDYYQNYGDKYVRRFTYELGPKLSPAGQKWLAQARINLQVAFETERAKDPAAFEAMEQDDHALARFAYASHAKAYLDAGLADLPLGDLLRIAETPDPKDLMTGRGVEQLAETAVGIARQRVTELLPLLRRNGATVNLSVLTPPGRPRLGALPVPAS